MIEKSLQEQRQAVMSFALLFKTLPLALLIFIPISLAAKFLHWGESAVFLTSALAIIPLSIWLGTATEKVAIVTGPAIGGIINAVFGNATALIIALVALNAGLVDIVKASITGSILGCLLLLLGLGMLTGGLRYKEQEFKPVLVRVNGASMTLAIIAIALPTLVISTSNVVDVVAIRNLSAATATVLITVYGLTLLFALKTHSYLYEINLSDKQTEEVDLHSSEPKESTQQPSLLPWLVVLLASAIAVAVESDLFVDVVEVETQRLGLTPLFTGVILLPLISDVAGYVTVTRLALKNNMDLVVSVVTGDSLLVALFVAPLLFFVGQFIGQPIDLNFNPFEVAAMAIAVLVANLVSFGGRSNWLDGTLLLSTYILLGIAFYYHPA